MKLYFLDLAFMILWIKVSIFLQAVDAFTNEDNEKAQKFLEKVRCLHPLNCYWSFDLKFEIFSTPKTIVPHCLWVHIIFWYSIVELPTPVFPQFACFYHDNTPFISEKSMIN